jgi:HlyD family secretion protein
VNIPTTRPDEADIEAVLGIDRPAASRLRAWRRYLLWAVLAALALAGLYALAGGGGGGTALRYITEPASRDNLTVLVTATGTVQPTNKVDISSELSGTVRKVLVDYNSAVKVGDLLAELDTDKLKATVESSRAKLVSARAHVEQAKATVEETRLVYERKRALVVTQAGSKQDVDTAKAAYDRAVAALAAAEADVGVAAAQLTLDETNLNKARIVSPINGVVLARNVDPGQTVASSFQAPVLFTIAEDLKAMEVQVDVDEADVGKVRETQRATFTVDAYADRKFAASIRELRFGSEVVQGVVTYKAVLATDNSELLLRPGMTATAEITVEEVADTLTVPNAALRFSPPVEEGGAKESFLSKLLPRMPQFRAASQKETTGDSRVVWVLKDGVATAVPVVIGPTDGRRTAIAKGELAPGQAVIIDTATATR